MSRLSNCITTVAMFLSIAAPTAMAQQQVSAMPAGLQSIRTFSCPQTTYQAALSGTPELQVKAAQALATGINDSSCTRHEPVSPAAKIKYRYLSNTGTNPSSKFYDAMCPRGRDLWLAQDPSTMMSWRPCKAAVVQAPAAQCHYVDRWTGNGSGHYMRQRMCNLACPVSIRITTGGTNGGGAVYLKVNYTDPRAAEQQPEAVARCKAQMAAEAAAAQHPAVESGSSTPPTPLPGLGAGGSK